MVGVKPVVFLGPSLPLQEARALLDADYQPPVRRGDLPALDPRVSTVGIVDGVFDQTLAVSPAEVRALLQRGIRVIGAGSMGALRAVELAPLGMEGIGTVHAWYAAGRIEADDEVALTFSEFDFQPCSIPLVSIRYAMEQAVSAQDIGADEARVIVAAARALPYPLRTVRAILAAAGVADEGRISEALRRWDVKRDDARALLRRLATLRPA